MNWIVLAATQATAVRGPTSPGYALDPLPLTDGRYVLPAAVLTDPAHEMRWATLAALPLLDDATVQSLRPVASH